nr:MAG TPA: hypothetical protein [Caudoviricetes sp.]
MSPPVEAGTLGSSGVDEAVESIATVFSSGRWSR